MNVTETFRDIFTARKWSLGQGNVFTPVCHSVHREEGGLPNPNPHWQTWGLGRPPWMQTPQGWADPLPRLGNPPRCRSPWVGQTPPRGWANPPPPIPLTSGRYISYWNAYLWNYLFWMNAFKFVKCKLWRTTSNVRSYSIALRLVPCLFCHQHKIFNSIQFNVQIKSLCQLYRRFLPLIYGLLKKMGLVDSTIHLEQFHGLSNTQIKVVTTLPFFYWNN